MNMKNTNSFVVLKPKINLLRFFSNSGVNVLESEEKD